LIPSTLRAAKTSENTTMLLEKGKRNSSTYRDVQLWLSAVTCFWRRYSGIMQHVLHSQGRN
jgi:hypothetical protein